MLLVERDFKDVLLTKQKTIVTDFMTKLYKPV